MQCTCGHLFGLDGNAADHRDSHARQMDASFVHLPPSLLLPSSPRHQARQYTAAPRDFLDRLAHAKMLEQIVMGNSDDAKDAELPQLCFECIENIEAALNFDTDRLEHECRQFREAMQDEQARTQALRRAYSAFTLPDGGDGGDDDDDDDAVVNDDYYNEDSDDGLRRAEMAYTDEIAQLTESVAQHEQELQNLWHLRKEQARISKHLDQYENDILIERNALELEARAFENDQQQLSQHLTRLESEVDALESNSIHLPSLLWDVQVDQERSLRYPSINDLRLGYRPKGDLDWPELQAAWSLAAQLLLAIGTIFAFDAPRDNNWKIVPLSQGSAKLMYYRNYTDEHGQPRQSGATVFNLGHPRGTSAAVRAWCSLLQQMIRHVSSRMQQLQQSGVLSSNGDGAATALVPALPFAISSSSIGGVTLSQLDEQDEAAWSRVIHYMTANLRWLSNCTATYMAQQVTLLSLC